MTEKVTTDDGVTFNDFIYHTPTRKFAFQPTGGTWRKSGVDAALPPVDDMPASAWLVRNRSVWHLPKRERRANGGSDFSG